MAKNYDDLKITYLREDIKNYEKVVMYGTGHMAHIVYNGLAESGIFPKFCVVSDKRNAGDIFEDIPVYDIGQCVAELRCDNVVVIIAVTGLYEKEIEDVLQRNHVKNYLCATRYARDLLTRDKCLDMTNEQCIHEIAKWYVEKWKYEDICLAEEIIRQKIADETGSSDKIMILAGHAQPRVMKIVGALKKKGFVVDILFFPTFINAMFSEQLQKLCDTYRYCSSVEEMMYHIIETKPKVIHLFAHRDGGVALMARRIIQAKGILAKIVYDEYDIINGMYSCKYIPKEAFEDERYCLVNADGLCCRGYEQEYLRDELHFKLGKMIQFFDYCND